MVDDELRKEEVKNVDENGEQLLELLFGNVSAYIEIRRIRNDRKVRRSFDLGLAELYKKRAEWDTPTSNVYFTVCSRMESKSVKQLNDEGREGWQNIPFIPCFWCDLDGKGYEGGKAEALESLHKFGLSPTAIVDSGHGYHAYWVFYKPLPLTRLAGKESFEAYQRGIAKKLGGDLAACDISHVLRMPGSMNVKDDPPLSVKLIQFNPDQRYEPADFNAYKASTEEDTEAEKEEEFTGKPEGQRLPQHRTLIMRFVQSNMPKDVILDAVLAVNKKNNPPEKPSEVCKLVNELWRSYKRPTPSKYFVSKTFISKLLGDDILNDYAFAYVDGVLYVYQDGVYQSNGNVIVAKECQWRLGQRRRSFRISETLDYIEVATRIENTELNKATKLINVKNGMLDWRTGELLPHSPNYLSTIQIPVEFQPDATPRRILQFFREVMPADCLNLARELVGYCLVPTTRFEKAFALVGGGAGGKSTFLNLLEKFLGTPNVSKVPLQELDEHRFKRAELQGKQVNMFADLDSRALRSSSYFKTIVSGDFIDAERKHRDPFFFRPFCRLIFSANVLPRSPDLTFAFYRRWVIIPFPNQFIGETANKELLTKLTTDEEFSGLLNVALYGLHRLFKNDDFLETNSTKANLELYQRQNDPVAAFIQDKCYLNPKMTITRAQLYDAYAKYCTEERFKQSRRQDVYDRLRSQPNIRETTYVGDRGFIGLCLKEDIDVEAGY